MAKKSQTKKLVAENSLKSTKRTARRAGESRRVRSVSKPVVKKKPTRDAPKDLSAVISISGSQYLVRVGDELELNHLDAAPEKDYIAEDVLLIKQGENVKIGTPTVKGAKVTLEVSEHKKGKKIIVFKYKAKSRYRKKKGFRASLTKVRVKSITV